MPNFDPIYREGVAKLNGLNLDAALGIAASLSTLEFFHGTRLFSPPMRERLRLLAEAVLDSKTASYKSQLLPKGQLAGLLNAVRGAMNDPKIATRLEGTAAELAREATQGLARPGYIQFKHQSINPVWIQSRGIRLLSGGSAVPPRLKHVPAKIEGVLGCSPSEMAFLHSSLLVSLQQRSNSMLKSIVRPPGPINHNEASVCDQIAQLATQDRWTFLFSENQIPTAKRDLSKLLEIFSATPSQHRETRRRYEYDPASDPWAMSSLETKPIVGPLETGRYAIPNFRFFARGFLDVIDRFLMAEIGEEYNNFRGYAQESYIVDLLRSRLDRSVVLEERPFSNEKGAEKGPDAVVVEESSIVLVESKARRLNPTLRFLRDEELLTRELRDPIAALHRLPKKLAAMNDSDNYREMRGLADMKAPIAAVAVISDSLPFANEIYWGEAKANPNLKLKDVGFPFAFLTLEQFERAIEIAAANDPPCSLQEIVQTAWEEAQVLDPQSPAAELFTKHPSPLERPYLTTLWEAAMEPFA